MKSQAATFTYNTMRVEVEIRISALLPFGKIYYFVASYWGKKSVLSFFSHFVYLFIYLKCIQPGNSH